MIASAPVPGFLPPACGEKADAVTAERVEIEEVILLRLKEVAHQGVARLKHRTRTRIMGGGRLDDQHQAESATLIAARSRPDWPMTTSRVSRASSPAKGRSK